MHIHRLAGDISVLNDHLEVPGIGFLPVNAFVLHAAEPVVVDTGLRARETIISVRSGVSCAGWSWQ